MKICFLIPSVASGGIEIYLLRFLRFLKDASEITVIVRNSDKGELYHEYLETGVHLKFLPLGYVNPLKIWRHYHYYKQQKFDVICDFNANFAGVPMFLGNLLNIPKRISFYRQGSNHFQSGIIRNAVNQLMKMLVYRNATSILSNSQAALDFFFPDRNVPDHRFQVVYNGFNFHEYTIKESKEDVRIKLNIPADAYAIGHVGRYDKAKNHETILKVFQQLLKEGLNCALVLCGRDTEKLLPRIKELGVDKKVIILGYRSDVSIVLKGLDCFIFPSITEGQPNALIEAMISGLPFVTSNIQSISEIVPRSLKSWMVCPIDSEQIIQKVLEIHSNYSLAINKVINAKDDLLENFDAKHNFNRLLMILNQ